MVKIFLHALLVAISFSALVSSPAMGSPLITIYVDPLTSTVVAGQNFTINIKISDVVYLYGWEFKLGWNPNLLDVIDVIEGPFLKQGGSTFFDKTINNTVGYILAYCTLLYDVLGVNGSGTLATVKFYAEKEGTSLLDLYETELVDSFEQLITHTANDGSVTVSKSVGGIVIPVSKLELLVPWIGSTSIIIFVFTAIVVFVKRRKKKG